jgi:quercetin dioxygenase-like cupin family protein
MMADRRRETLNVLPLDAPLLTFDLPDLVRQIKSEETWHKAERNTIPLFKTDRMRGVLLALRAGTVISSHRADGPITVQLLEGRIRFSAESQTVTLVKGQLLTLQAGLPHAVEAEEESVFLLTVALAAAPEPQ